MLLTVVYEDKDLYHFEVDASLALLVLITPLAYLRFTSFTPLLLTTQTWPFITFISAVKVEGDVSIGNLKAMLEASTEVSVAQQALIYNGKELQSRYGPLSTHLQHWTKSLCLGCGTALLL